MEKRHSLLMAILITLLIAGNYYFFFYDADELERAVVARVIDGDTFELEDGRVVRMLNINTPEKRERGSDEAIEFLKEYEGKEVRIEITGTERYGRLLGRVYSDNGEYINIKSVRLGLAHTLLVDKGEVKDFGNVQKEAFENEIGVWNRSEYYGCLKAEINKKEEYVIVKRNCDADIEEWTIKDETTRKYTFEKNIVMGEFYVYSEKGQDEGEKLYWGRGSVWNDDRDSIFVRDGDGLLVFYDDYGY